MTDGTAPLTPAERGLLAACGLWLFATFFTPWGWPGLDGYPAIERFLDPDFLPNDFYTQTAASFSTDTLIAYGVGSFEQATGVPYALSIAILNAARILFWPWALYRFVQALLRDHATGLVAAVLATLATLRLPYTPGWGYGKGDQAPHNFSIFVMLLAWTWALERRPGRAMIAMAVACALHPLVAVYGIAFLGLIFVFDMDGAERRATLTSVGTWVGAVGFAGAFLGQLLGMKATVATPLDAATYIDILAFERHPHHFVPSHFRVFRWIGMVVSLCLTTGLVVRYRGAFRGQRLIAATLATYVLAAAAGYAFVEILPLRVVVQFTPYRFAVVAAPVMLAVLAWFTHRAATSGHAPLFALTIGACFFYPLFHWPPKTLQLAVFVLSVLGALALDGKEGSDLQTRLGDLLRHPRAVPGFAAALALSAVGFMSLRPDAYVLPTLANQHPVYTWIHDHTPEDAVFLTDQYGDDSLRPQRVRLLARRAVMASRDFPFREDHFVEWHTRWQAAFADRAFNRVTVATGDELAAIAAIRPFDHVLRQLPLDDPRFEELAAFPGDDDTPYALHVYRYTPAK